MKTPFFKKIDCVMLYVPNLEEAIAFYRDRLGHPLAWRSAAAAGLKMPDTDAELVLQTERKGLEVDFLVPSADAAAREFERAGGKVLAPPFDIQIGRCVVVQDPWENTLVLLDASKGLLITDEQGNITGNQPLAQLRMVWPEARLAAPPAAQIPAGYALRAYRPGDEARFFELMALAGWPGWDEEKLGPWRPRMLADGWLMVVYEASQQIVASCLALRDMQEFGVTGGELGWLASDPAHAGRGLGLAVSAAVTARMIAEGYHHIHLYTEDYRLAAVKIYLKLGYVPYLYQPGMRERWQEVCAQLGWPYTPETWREETDRYGKG